MQQGGPQQAQIKAGDEEIKGRYSNLMQVTQTKEEFCLDFLSAFPPAGAMVARIVVSPGHLKRMSEVLVGAIKRYEEQFAPIEVAREPEKPTLGFSAN